MQTNFVEIEKKWLKRWYSSGLVEKYLHRNDKSSKRFSFIDGPITANNPMGVHHAWGRTLKDLFQRYKNMQGYQQRFQNGFDCQGLWVEVEVEKEAGFNSKKDIEKFGIAKFTQACKDRVNKYALIQTEQSKRLGMFMDWENSYYTNSENNNLYIWRFLKTIWEKGWLYKDKSSATWCSRCETGLSQHEQADGYKEITDTSVYVKFKIKNRLNEYLLAWTTTPWTLSANVLLAINPKYEYVKVKNEKNIFYLAKEAAVRLKLAIIEKIDPKILIGIEYNSLYDIPAQKGINHQVVCWDLVDPKEGTGIVHVAPGCGQEDYLLGKSLKTEMISPLDSRGYFVAGYGNLSGKYAHDVNRQVIDYLEKNEILFKTETITHRYPHCWRCGTKCLFRLEDDWFINCTELKPKLKINAAKAKWIPIFAGKRMQNWLDNMGDWMISRKRYYGLALPFYECVCGILTVIGSKEELKKLAVNPNKVDQLPSLHRPWIDEIKIKCPKCKKAVSRIPDVGDCWLDAGAVPFSTLKYFEDKKYWHKWYPAEFIGEMIEQVRLWYYSMLVYGTVFENSVPYLTVLNYMEVNDEKGERMSKTKGNGIPFDQATEKMGVDVMRWLYCRQNPAQNLNFGYQIGDETRRKFHLLLWNIYSFYLLYKNNKKGNLSLLDKWIISKLNNLIEDVSVYLNNYRVDRAVKEIELFVNDLSVWYLRRSRGRKDGYQTLSRVLITLSKLLAPFTPFISEEIFSALTGKESVHLEDWPKVDKNQIDKKLEEQMVLVRQICELGHGERKRLGIKVRQPLSKLLISNFKFLKNVQMIQLIKDELNIKEVQTKEGKGEIKVMFDTTITPELKAEGEARDLVRQVQDLRKKAGCRLNQKIIIYAPNLPKTAELQNYLKSETLAEKLVESADTHITAINH